MPQFVHEKDGIPSETYKFCGTLLPKQKKMIKTIPNKFVDIGRCDKCIVQPLMRAFGIDLEKEACGGKELFQKFFPECPTFCDITQLVASEFISNINTVSSARVVKI
jgi:hypothetical protein